MREEEEETEMRHNVSNFLTQEMMCDREVETPSHGVNSV